eukprot:TRINITY_DN32819_c0_g2_i1.p1 TRINITY_DN32819_c0_g2~~TRINITY_DN32819_c0_g2_i1.p1  ORF type:complete len:1004 (+),score=312.04 TRINITY_DN32819_c0_g2_i1:185-3196(+)
MASRHFRVEKDEEGNAEVTPRKNRKLRPLEDEEPSPKHPKPALKSALKGSKPNPQEPGDIPYKPADAVPPPPSPTSSPPSPAKPALKSAMKGKKAPSPEEQQEEKPVERRKEEKLEPLPPPGPPPASKAPPKPALKSAMKSGGAPARRAEEPAAPARPAPPAATPAAAPAPATSGAAPQAQKAPMRSALKGSRSSMEVSAAPAGSALKAPAPAAPRTTSLSHGAKKEDGQGAMPAPVGAGRLQRPSTFRMKADDEDEDYEKWTHSGLLKHYYYYAGQKLLWDAQNIAANRSRKSIKLEDLGRCMSQSSQAEQALETRHKMSLLRKSELLIIEESAPADAQEAAESQTFEISPLKDLLLEKKPDEKKIRQALIMLKDQTENWINASLDSTPPAMPPPLISAVAAVQSNVVEVLIQFKADVKAQYQGKSMLKGWVKPMTPLLDSVRGRKGRFVGTMLGEKLTKIEAMLFQAECAESGENGNEEEGADSDADEFGEGNCAPPPAAQAAGAAANSGRRKSFHMPTSRGAMEHTHAHPNTKYELTSSFCDGSLNSVREAVHLETNVHASIKAGNKFYEMSGKDPEADLWNEIGILRKMVQPNVIKLLETYEDETHIFMVFEHCSGGDLFDRLLDIGYFSEDITARYAYQIVAAIHHLHSQQICHRDIQPESFLFLNQGDLQRNTLKLANMPTAKEFNGPLFTKVCTLHYVAPEILTCSPEEGYTEKIDMWSFGVLLYIMLAGLPPFNMDDDMKTLQAVKSGAYSFQPEQVWKGISKDMRGLVSSLLVVKPSERMDVHQAMQHKVILAAKDAGAAEGEARVPSKSDGPAAAHSTKMSSMRNAFTLLAERMSNTQLEELRSKFKELDPQKSGMVDFEDVRGFLMRMVSVEMDATDLRAVLNKVSGKVNYQMYMATMTDWRRHIRREAAHAIFSLFDIDKNGNISLYEIAQALGKSDMITGLKKKDVSHEEVGKIWVEMRDVFGKAHLEDKEMTFEEFYQHLPRSNEDISF